MEIVGEELESPCVNPGLFLIEVTSQLDRDPVDAFLGCIRLNEAAHLLVNVVISFGIAYVYGIDAETVNALSVSLYHGAFLDQELVGLVPVASLVHLDGDANALFLQPEDVRSLAKSRDLDEIDTPLVALILHEFHFGE